MGKSMYLSQYLLECVLVDVRHDITTSSIQHCKGKKKEMGVNEKRSKWQDGFKVPKAASGFYGVSLCFRKL